MRNNAYDEVLDCLKLQLILISWYKNNNTSRTTRNKKAVKPREIITKGMLLNKSKKAL